MLFLFLPAGWPLGGLAALPACYRAPFPPSGWAAAWFPTQPSFAWQAGRELAERGDIAGALCLYARAAAWLAGDAAFAADYGDMLLQNGDAAAAVSVWLDATDPDGALLSRLAEGYERLRDWIQADVALSAWLSRHPDDVERRFRLALVRAAQDPESALGLLDQAAEEGRQDAAELAAAIRAARRASDPAFLYARTGEELIRLREWRLAAAAFREAVTIRPDYGEAFALLGWAEENAGADPEESYRTGAALSPQSSTACLLYGSWLRRTDRFDLARIWLERAWAMDKGDWAAAAELAALDFRVGRPAAAEARLTAAVEAHPQEADAWLALAEFYIDHEIRVETGGIPAARRALLLSPEDARAMLLLGRAYYLTGKLDAAADILRRVLALAPDSETAHLFLGYCLMELGRQAEAEREFREAVRLDPAGSTGRQARERLDRLQDGFGG